VGGVTHERSFEVECPHCRKTFTAEPIDAGRAARYLGFKCPHCKLFVPLERATDAPLDRDPDAAS
jgi:phage FluMu protein Com